MDDIKVSIICNAYNQEEYIANALDSFLMQKTNFKYEVLIHDDASTDGTADIIREYEKKYPEIIKPIYQTENQYQKKQGISMRFQYPRVKGKYIAFCEGDDYWIDPLKLQKQYDILEAHPEIDICTHGALKVNAESKKEISKIAPSRESRIMPMEEVIMGDGGYVAANSMFFRSEIKENIPEFWQKFRYQFCIKLRASIKGGMYYIADIMSAYRVLSKGSWTSKMKNDSERWIQFHEQKKNMFKLFDEYTGYQYTKVIEEKIRIDEFYKLLQIGDYKGAMKKHNKKYFKKLSKKTRIKIFIKGYFPWIAKMFAK